MFSIAGAERMGRIFYNGKAKFLRWVLDFCHVAWVSAKWTGMTTLGRAFTLLADSSFFLSAVVHRLLVVGSASTKSTVARSRVVRLRLQQK